MSDRHNGVVLGQLVVLNPARLNGREEHRGSRKNALAITLDEVRGRRPDSNDEVGRFIGIEGVKIIHEWSRLICRRPTGRSEASGRENPLAFAIGALFPTE